MSLYHNFYVPSKTQNSLITRRIGNVEWTLKLIVENDKAEVVISNEPIGKITCPLVPWTVTFDVSVSTTSWDREDKNNVRMKKAVTSEELGYVKINHSLHPCDGSLKIRITKIRRKGLHEFEMKNFDSTNADEDLVLDVNGEKLHCHRQILSWNSEIFRTMIKESQATSEICLKDSIPVEDLRELLHYLYLPCEPVDDHNFRKLLQWGEKFQVKHVVQLCQRYMESLVLGQSITDAIRIEIFLLSWRYSVEHLKKMYAIKTISFKSSDWMMKIVQNEVYQDMDEDLKLQMWESVIEIFKYGVVKRLLCGGVL